MKNFPLLFLAAGVAFCMAAATAADEPKLNPNLEPLRPLLGKTWRGVFKDSKPDKPTVDVARWERALNGQAIRVLHSVNEGAYGGETIIWWDQARTQVAYHYFTTAGFNTSGTMTLAAGKVTALEKVSGNKNGITEVRSTSELRPDGTLWVKAEYLKDGQPAGERETLYKEDPKAEVKFR